jgi:hypothetical protein
MFPLTEHFNERGRAIHPETPQAPWFWAPTTFTVRIADLVDGTVNIHQCLELWNRVFRA